MVSAIKMATPDAFWIGVNTPNAAECGYTRNPAFIKNAIKITKKCQKSLASLRTGE